MGVIDLDVQYHNVAGRLHALLTVAKKKASAHKLVMLWYHLLVDQDTAANEKPAADTFVSVHRALVPVHNAVLKVEQDIHQQYPSKTEIYLRHFPAIWRAVIGGNLDGQSDFVKDTLKEEVLYGLEHCAIDLPVEQPTTYEEIDDLHRQIHDLIISVRDGNLDPKLKAWVLRMLVQLSKALDEFNVTGAEGVDAAITVLAGEIVRNMKAKEDFENKDPTAFQKFSNICKRAATIAERTNAFIQLGMYAADSRGWIRLITQQ